jgi:hypothetical protein
MNFRNFMPLFVGGLLPAIIFGVGGVLQKFVARAGMGVGPYLAVIGLSVTVIGLAITLFIPDRSLSIPSILFSTLLGLTWAAGTALIIVALQRYGTPLAKLVPLYNMNTLVTVLLALGLFAEWKEVSVIKLLLGTVLIVIGGTLVAHS